MFGRVQPQDVLALSRARIDSADVFAACHLPNRRYHAFLLHGVIRNVF